jgi:tripartite-type tricarboxylate transporter receptor subunit TctC
MPVCWGASVKLPRRHFLQLATGAAALAALPHVAAALDYPTRPVRIVVGFPAGGGSDITARLIGQWLSERLGQPFIVENRPGAATNLAAEAVAKSAPDGYTLLLFGSSGTINATLYDNLSYDLVRDIAPVAGTNRVPYVMEVTPSVPAKTVPEFIAYAKANPGKINMASAGNGSVQHVSGELFKMMTGVSMVHVPYRGGAPALTDLIGGRVQIMFDALTGSVQYIRAGKLRALAVTTATRVEVLPDLPTLSDSVPGYETSSWSGIGAPRNTPTEIIERLNKEINAALADAKMRARLADLGGVPMPMSSAEFGKLISESVEKWAKVIKFASIKLE